MKVMAVAAGPLAIAGTCSVPVFGAGTAFALFLAGCGLYVVRTLALVETSGSPRGEIAWRIELNLLVAMSACVLFGFLLARLAVGADIGSPETISGAALLRTIWGLFYYRSAGPLLTYNALFVPVFLVAGLGCMVMSALFRQAAEMKAENDLTI